MIVLAALSAAFIALGVVTVGCESPAGYNERGERAGDVKVGDVERQGIYWRVMVRPDGSAYLQSPWSDKVTYELVGVTF